MHNVILQREQLLKLKFKEVMVEKNLDKKIPFLHTDRWQQTYGDNLSLAEFP